MNTQRSNNRVSASFTLATFIAMSFGIHASMFFINIKPIEIELGTDIKNVISVHINQNTKQFSQQSTSPNVEDTKPEQTSASGQKITSTEIIGTNKQHQSSSSNQQNMIIGQLQQELARFFYYPSQAMRRGIQGKVVIGFNINLQGKIHSVVISKSSGYTILDNAALNSFNLASQNFSSLSSQPPQYLDIPVKYKLSGG